MYRMLSFSLFKGTLQIFSLSYYIDVLVSRAKEKSYDDALGK